MISTLIDAQALLNAVGFLASWFLFGLVLIVLGAAFFVLRKLTKQGKIFRRRVFKTLGYLLVPGLIIPIGLIVVLVVFYFWPRPKIEITWDFSQGASMAMLDPSRCLDRKIQEVVFDRVCIYEGDLSVAILLPEGRKIHEKAYLVRVDGKDDQITSLWLLSEPYPTEKMHERVSQLIEEWGLDPQRFRDWRSGEEKEQQGELYYGRDDASKTRPTLSLTVRAIEEGDPRRPWSLGIDLLWE